MLQYVVRPRKNITDQSIKYYPQVAPTSPIGFEELSRKISDKCTVTRPDIKAVLAALEDEIIEALVNGNSVRLGDLGSFRPTFHSVGMPTAKEVTAEQILRVRCRFASGGRLTRELSVKSGRVQFQPFRMPVIKSSGPEEHI